MARCCLDCRGVGAEPCDCPGACPAGTGVRVCCRCNGSGIEPAEPGPTGWRHTTVDNP